MTILLHGTNPPHPIYGSWTFAAMAQKYQTNISKIHLIIGNRLTQYSGAAKASKALSDATSQGLYSTYQKYPVHGTNVQIDRGRINDCLSAIDNVIDML